MNYKKNALLWITVFVTSFILDLIAHIGITGGFEAKELIGVIKPMESVNFLPLIFEYVILSTGITYFLMETNAFKKSLSYSAFVGGLIGLMIYGIYSLINISFLIKWSWSVVVMDTVTGVVVMALSSALAYLVFHKK